MQYKALILDLDDTTLPHGKDSMPSARVSEAIAKARAKIHVCIATGRTLKDAKPVLGHLRLSGPCIVANGTQIFDPVREIILHEVRLPSDVIPRVYNVCTRHGVTMTVLFGEEEAVYAGGPIPPNAIGVFIPEVTSASIEHITADLKEITGVRVQRLAAWDKRFLSLYVSDERASKLHGIVEVAKILKIQTEEIIGVGDGYNDFPLLMASGLKIAMGNAVPELKAIADFIAPTVEEDGVAVVIEKFVLS